MTGSSSKRKGSAFERELVERHRAIGVRAQRVPLSGALASILGPEYADDVVVGDPHGPHFRAECKKRRNGEGFRVLEGWLGSADMLVLRRNRAEPMVVLPWATYEALIRSVAETSQGFRADTPHQDAQGAATGRLGPDPIRGSDPPEITL